MLVDRRVVNSENGTQSAAVLEGAPWLNRLHTCVTPEGVANGVELVYGQCTWLTLVYRSLPLFTSGRGLVYLGLPWFLSLVDSILLLTRPFWVGPQKRVWLLRALRARRSWSRGFSVGEGCIRGVTPRGQVIPRKVRTQHAR